MNFPNIKFQAQTEMLAPRPLFLTREDEQRHHRAQQQLATVEADKRVMKK
jgi:hypothetical protein